jgi:hypothetical protein
MGSFAINKGISETFVKEGEKKGEKILKIWIIVERKVLGGVPLT